ncbi:hypothetical protein B9G55_04155 [Saccharibacillus sp. O16]|nr:hypothetical protein B9G55_04155 [Saccharibacillus sp. O16]
MEMHTMNDEFLKDLHELERSDEDRSKLLMKGIKKTLAERQAAGRLERWFNRKRKRKVEAWHAASHASQSKDPEPKPEERQAPLKENTYRENRYETRTE